MGRKIEFQKIEIEKAAFFLLEQEGIENFTIRNIARILNSSTSPIYYHFKSLEEIENTMADKIVDIFLNFVKNKQETDPFSKLTIAFALFSKQYRKLFESIFLHSNTKGENSFRSKIYDRVFSLIEAEDKKFNRNDNLVDLLFGHGLALNAYHNYNLDFIEEEVYKLMDAYILMRKERSKQ